MNANTDLNAICLKRATLNDKATLVDIDYRLNQYEHISLKREQKITRAILENQCFIILANNSKVGFVIFDYRFFDQGWIELIIIDKGYRGRGIGGKTIDLICEQSKSSKVFTSTNLSNTPMQSVLAKAGFMYSGKLEGLDDDDPELFYYKVLTWNK